MVVGSYHRSIGPIQSTPLRIYNVDYIFISSSLHLLLAVDGHCIAILPGYYLDCLAHYCPRNAHLRSLIRRMTDLVSDLVARAAPSPAQQAAIAAAIYHFNVELWTLYAFGVAITILRTYARVRSVGWKLQADDYLAWVAIVRTDRLFLVLSG